MGDNYRNKLGQLQSGHPGLKKPGSRAKLSKRAVLSISNNFEPIINSLISNALAGDTQAAKILLSLAVPKDLIEINDMTPDGLVREINAGNLTAVEMSRVATTLQKICELSELAEIKDRMNELEAILNSGET